MPQPQLINIVLHVLAGSAAINLGFFLLARSKGTPRHRQRGRLFAWLTLLVCATAAIGNLGLLCFAWFWRRQYRLGLRQRQALSAPA